MSREALVHHYNIVADASAVPVIIYNMPACSGIDMDAETIIEIAHHPNIIGIKDSGGNLKKMENIIRETESDFQYLTGAAGVLLPSLSGGAVGGILALANIAPGLCLEIYEAYHAGDLEKAHTLQEIANPVNAAVTKTGGIPALKAAMDYLGMFGGPVRSPLLPMNEEDLPELHQLLNGLSG